jgi:hypothetical protein
LLVCKECFNKYGIAGNSVIKIFHFFANTEDVSLTKCYYIIKGCRRLNMVEILCNPVWKWKNEYKGN